MNPKSSRKLSLRTRSDTRDARMQYVAVTSSDSLTESDDPEATISKEQRLNSSPGLQRRRDYIDSCDQLPLDRPFAFPHLVDTKRIFLGNYNRIHLADAIATILWHTAQWHEKTKVLSAFLDSETYKHFSWVRDEGADSPRQSLVILRWNLTVRVGFIPGSESRDASSFWDPQICYEIDQTGKWCPKYFTSFGRVDGRFYQAGGNRGWQAGGERPPLAWYEQEALPVDTDYILGEMCYDAEKIKGFANEFGRNILLMGRWKIPEKSEKAEIIAHFQ